MVGITRNVAGVSPLHSADGVDEAVPDGFAFAVFVPGSFSLIRRGGCAKNKFFGKLERREFHLRLEQFACDRRARRQDMERCRGAESPAQKITTSQTARPTHKFLLNHQFQET